MKKIIILILFLTGFLFFDYGKVEAACDADYVINQIRGVSVDAPGYIAPTFGPSTWIPGGCDGDCLIGESRSNSYIKTINIPSDCYGYLDITMSGLFSTGWDCWKANIVTVKIGNSTYPDFGYQSHQIVPSYPDCSYPKCGSISFEETISSYYIMGGPRPNINVELYYWAKCEYHHNHSGHYLTVSNVNFTPIDTSCPAGSIGGSGGVSGICVKGSVSTENIACPSGSIDYAGVCVQGSASQEPILCPSGTTAEAWGDDEICVNATIDDSGRTCGNGTIDGTGQTVIPGIKVPEECDPGNPPTIPANKGVCSTVDKCVPVGNQNECTCAECMTDADCPAYKRWCEGQFCYAEPQKCTDFICEKPPEPEDCGTSDWAVPRDYKCINKYTVGKKFEYRTCRDTNCQTEVFFAGSGECPYQGDWPDKGVQCYIPDSGSTEKQFCQSYTDDHCSLGGCVCYCEAHCETSSVYRIDEEDIRTGECRDCVGGGILTPTNVTTGQPDPDYEVSKCGSGGSCTTYSGCDIDWPYNINNSIDQQCENSYGVLSKARFLICRGVAPYAECGKNLEREWLVSEKCEDKCTATGKQKCGTQNNKPVVQGEYKCSKCLVDEKKTVTASASVSINEPLPNFNISCSASPNPVKTGENVTFTAIVSGGTGPYTYTWSGACEGSSASCTNSFSSPGEKSALLIVVSDDPYVRNVSCSVSVVASAPELNVSCSASPSTTIPGQNVTFSCLISGGKPPYKYSWSGDCVGESGEGSTASCTTPFPDPGPYSATLSVSTGTGEAYCSKWTDWRTVQECSGPVDLTFFCWGKDIYKLEIGSDWSCQTGPNNTAKCVSGSANGLTQWQSCQGFCCKGGPKSYSAFGGITGTFPECYGSCPTGTTQTCGECGGTQTCDYSCNWGSCVGATCHTECVEEQGNLTCKSIDGPGEDECETDENCESDPPTVTGLIPETYCIGVPGCGEISFQWTYQDPDGDSESKFDMQVSSSPLPASGQDSCPLCEVNRTFSNLSNPSGSTNTQIISVRNFSTSPGCDYITFDESYYVRVRVWDSTGLNSGWVPYDDPTDADGDGNPATFLKDPHPWPSAEFIFEPSNPDPDQEVIFPDLSICYDSNSDPYPCKLENPITGDNNQYTWTFGDGESSDHVGDTSHTYAAKGIYTVTLEVCDDVGCCQKSHDVPVGVNQGGAQEWKEIPPPF